MTDESLKEEILINVTPSEVRAALLENGILQEVHIERSARRGVISNVYKGRVSRVLPGMYRHRPAANRFPACVRHHPATERE